MGDFLIGVILAAFGVYLIIRRKQEAASTVKQQNRFWRKTYGPREVKQSERAAVIVGIFSILIALAIWLR
jgi:hypothetical protein